MWRKMAKVGIVGVFVASLIAMLGAGLGQPPLPPLPNKFSGKIFVDGQPAWDEVLVFARVVDYESKQIPVKNGQYGKGATPFLVSPPADSYFNKQITFHATLGFGDVEATETASFLNRLVSATLDLHFPPLPAAPPPTPTPTPSVTPTPTATPSLPIPGDTTVPRLATVVLVGGVATLSAGGLLLLWVRRRKTY